MRIICLFLLLVTGDCIYGQSGLRVFNVSGQEEVFIDEISIIDLSGSEKDVTYELIGPAGLEYRQTGTGGSLIFSGVFGPGTYKIVACRGTSRVNMKGTVVISYKDTFMDVISISPSELSFSCDEQEIGIEIDNNGDLNYDHLYEFFECCNNGQIRGWNPLDFVWVVISYNEIYIVALQNNTSKIKKATVRLGSINLELTQEAGIDSIEIPGYFEKVMLPDKGKAIVNLVNSQEKVIYRMETDDGKHYSSSKEGTGDVLELEVDAPGWYNLEGRYGTRRKTLGMVKVIPVMNTFVLSGGGSVEGNKSVQLSLSGSQSTLEYELLRYGEVYCRAKGSGSPLYFTVKDAGVYTVRACFRNDFSYMPGSISIGAPADLNLTQTENREVTYNYLSPSIQGNNICHVVDVIYKDGVNRVKQEINIDGTGAGGDIVLIHQYDMFGKEKRQYLPYGINGNRGQLVPNATNFIRWEGVVGVSDLRYAYKETRYDGSSLQRALEEVGPGEAWHVNNKNKKYEWGSNKGNEVYLWKLDNINNPTSTGFYPANSLRKSRVIDEDGCLVEEFRDNNDQVVLTTVHDSVTVYKTYHVYDDLGYLRWVIPPAAATSQVISSDLLSKYCYSYKYDDRGLVIEKKLPGTGVIYYLYDQKERLVLKQDGKQRSENKWSYSCHDKYDREVEGGECVLAININTLRSAVRESNEYALPESRLANLYVSYDNYIETPNIIASPFVPRTNYSMTCNPQTSGLITKMKVKVLETNQWLTTTIYYNDDCQIIQIISDNLFGKKSWIDVKFDFQGNVLQEREMHERNGEITDVLEKINSFDSRGRKLMSTVTLNDRLSAVESYTYDLIGRLKTRKCGIGTNAVLETMEYNPRGWLIKKESPCFKMKLRYENPEGGTKARYNGNISELEWQQGNNGVLMYGLTYDRLNRLSGCVQKQKTGTTWEPLVSSYIEKNITYDPMGNIKTLQRLSKGVLVDNLLYSYTGNQLSSLTEYSHETAEDDIYIRGNAAEGTYSYDQNGNMIKDSRRGLDFKYNVLDLLSEIKVGNTVKAKYCYLADGTKLRVRDSGSNGFDYLGSLTYKSGNDGVKLETANFGSGVIRASLSNSAQSEVNYFLTDHLGSVRVIVDGSGTVKERNDYYPFGARHVRADYPKNDNRFLYNGKEEQVAGDLDYLDYGSRMYDSELGRWFGMDPMAEKFYGMSPYSYVFNNPLLWIDPNGELPVVAIPIGGIFVIIGVMDMVAIGLGLVTSGVILQNAFDRHKVELTEEVADFWTTMLTSMSLMYVEEYKRNNEKEWQDRKDREAKDIFNQSIVDMQNSIGTNYGGPTPDGSADPKRDMGPTAKKFWGAIILITAMHNCDMTVTPESDGSTNVYGNFIKGIINYFFGEEKDNNEKKKK